MRREATHFNFGAGCMLFFMLIGQFMLSGPPLVMICFWTVFLAFAVTIVRGITRRFVKNRRPMPPHMRRRP